ncbi:glucosidase II beta subunit-like protein [Colletotrichum higginsianum]|uniref:Endoplasmic reticulum lectin n=2 Tax=Colletotrichum higginsianum TaxID=80884 RepID=H1UVS7_COLHI|nr:Glucosidase II beta subunit-like protein [Colletotrichum higginsianum IMI 349063]OBR09254.1 Glucosidase II beta subunit-like protein [Colletotrichum higginsianum IMI 349063]TIC95666.1 Protein OS-9-like protein [Colletotrichum higginsianum]CCF32078.1 glucosidase II beta subunit-like protein [Colletotrichum higginsianum]
MRRINLVLLATTAQLCGARHPGFSIHDDLVAYPQYEIVFSDSFILEHDAQALLDRASPHSTYSAEFSASSDISQNVREAADGDDGDSDSADVFEKYEIMNMNPSKYLCSIPVLEPQTPENHTATELAKQEEARELAKASAHGWELLDELDGNCLYFMSGWWSYSFCYNREVTQFHALPTVPNGQPPVRDPHTAKYVLGQVPQSPSQRRQAQNNDGEQHQEAAHQSWEPPANTDLQVKGDQRYLVQRMEGGTLCDLTGRDRTIEVQYHCVPGIKGDRIGWIKEVTTCAYLMVVNTPRLCDDVAFLPPRVTRANPISCQLILPSDDVDAQTEWHRQKTLEAEEAMTEKKTDVATGSGGKEGEQSGQLKHSHKGANGRDGAQKGVNVGGVIVGARNVLADGDEEGKPPTKLAPPRSYLPGRGHGPLVEIIASAKSKAEGGATEVLDESELKKLDLSPELVEEMRAELERIAGDKGWKLEVVEQPGDPREIRGIVDHGSEGELGEDVAKGKRKKKAAAVEGRAQQQDEDQEQEQEGSEEHFFHEEL